MRSHLSFPAQTWKDFDCCWYIRDFSGQLQKVKHIYTSQNLFTYIYTYIYTSRVKLEKTKVRTNARKLLCVSTNLRFF